MKGWLDLETAADRLAQRSRDKPFRALPGSEAKKVLRELRDLVVSGIVQAQLKIEGDGLRYRQLTTSDALAPPFGIHFELDGTLGAETIFAPGVLRPMLVREADLDVPKQSANATGVRFLTRRDLELRGIRFANSHQLKLEAEGKFPKRRYLSPSRIAWIESEINEWIALKLG